MSKLINAILLLVAAVVFALPLAADEFKSCARCHGEDGNSPKSSSPSIAGFNARYTTAAMEAYRDGKRECVSMKLKCKIAAKWSDEEIASAAAHYAQFEYVAREQPFDEALATTGQGVHEEKCASCHSAAAVASADAQPAGMLNGQWREYLEYSLEEYANGGRPQPDEMRSALESLDDAQREALLQYYASGR